MRKSKSYFSRHVFRDKPDEHIDLPITAPNLPMTEENAIKVLKKIKEISGKYDSIIGVEVTIWVRNEDGSEEQIIVPEYMN